MTTQQQYREEFEDEHKREAVKREHGCGYEVRFKSKEEAIQYALSQTRSQGGEVIVHDESGKIVYKLK